MNRPTNKGIQQITDPKFNLNDTNWNVKKQERATGDEGLKFGGKSLSVGQ